MLLYLPFSSGRDVPVKDKWQKRVTYYFIMVYKYCYSHCSPPSSTDMLATD